MDWQISPHHHHPASWMLHKHPFTLRWLNWQSNRLSHFAWSGCCRWCLDQVQWFCILWQSLWTFFLLSSDFVGPFLCQVSQDKHLGQGAAFNKSLYSILASLLEGAMKLILFGISASYEICDDQPCIRVMFHSFIHISCSSCNDFLSSRIISLTSQMKLLAALRLLTTTDLGKLSAGDWKNARIWSKADMVKGEEEQWWCSWLRTLLHIVIQGQQLAKSHD